jgi:[protein-PII] uridylyltransferase
MERIRQPRDVINRREVTAELDKLVSWSGYSPSTQGRVRDILKAALAKGRDEIRTRFEQEAVAGAEIVATNCYLIDQLVRIVYDFATRYVYPVANPTAGEQVTIAATGGYGRYEMAPFSDVDLLFLQPYKQTPRCEQIVEFTLYLLWDLKLKVGHATRSIDDCVRLARDDLTIRSSLLDARWLWGDEALYKEFQRRYQQEVVAASGAYFVEAKLAERDARHERMGDARYLLEPNVKEGKGGLRDLQTLHWLARYLYGIEDLRALVDRGVLTTSDAHRFAKARNFLWTVRCHLHYLTGRAEERLTLDRQGQIATRMGYRDHAGASGLERFMKHYFLIAKDVGDLTRIFCAVLEEQHKKRRFRFSSLPFLRRSVSGFRIDGERLTVEKDDTFSRDPVRLLRLFHEAQRHDLDIHPVALRLVHGSLRLIDRKLRTNPEANQLFLDILTAGKDTEKTLRRMNEAGVFGAFIPDFGRVVAQMQYDMYHVYTTDEHTIRALGFIERIERGELKEDHPMASAAIREIQSRRVLYLAVLCHDIAKGRGGDHSVLGARIARRLCRRFALGEWETDTVVWLVLHHLDMSHTAFRRDLDEPKTIQDFVDLVQSPERLRLLIILTVADIRAVAPTVWNNWKATLLRELYIRANEVMTGGVPAERRTVRVKAAQEALRERLAGWSQDEIDAHLTRGYPDYWLAFDTDAHVRHAELVRGAERDGKTLHIETRIDKTSDVTEITVYTPDHAGLFSQIAGAMALAGASIVNARIVTLSTGMALDVFWIQDASGGAFDTPDRLERMRARIGDALSGRLRCKPALEAARRQPSWQRTELFSVPPRVIVDNKISDNHTVIEINGKDRLGFLFDVTSALTELSLQITRAYITTYGERVVDVFYVKDVFGLKVEHEEKLKDIRARLLQAIAPGEAVATAAAE